MKKLPLTLALLTAGFATLASANTTLTVAASITPHAEILKHVIPVLKKQGVDLVVKEFSDYVQPNVVVYEKYVDINFYQHLPYLKKFNEQRGYNLIPVFPVIVTPFGVYSHKVKNVHDVRDGGTVAIPNDPTNGARALLLLQAQGLIKLKDPKDVLATPRDIVYNPKHLRFKEIEAATLPRVIDDVDLDTINVNYALKAGFNPTTDAIATEDKDSPYANYVVVRPDNKDRPEIELLRKALYTQEVYDWILKTYKGAVLPTFVPLDKK